MMISYPDLSRTVSHALRHEPSAYGLVLDSEGYVRIADLLDALRRMRPMWQDIDEPCLREMVERSQKRRHEIVDGRIRALYGHSTEGRSAKQFAAPPELLFHGTDPSAAENILLEGLKPMERQYVHLSSEPHAAREVGARKSITPVVLRIRAGEAYRNGVVFFEGNESVWLAEFIPPLFIMRNH